MAFPYGWKRKCPLTIQASGIDSDLTNFPVLLTEDTLPLEMFDADGNYTAISGGGDIRFSSDSDGNTQLACEIVNFVTDNDPNNGKAEIWVKVPTISSGVDTTFYVWYGNDGETQPAPDDTYGSENVWDSHFKGVWHMNQDPSGDAPQELDSASNHNNGISNGEMISDDLVKGQVGRALSFDGSNDYIDGGGFIKSEVENSVTVSVWIKPSDLGDGGIIGQYDNHGYYRFALWYESSTLYFEVGNDSTSFETKVSSTAISTANQWYRLVGTYDQTNVKLYINDNEVDSASENRDLGDVSCNFFIGTVRYDGVSSNDCNETDDYFNGIIDEVRISNIARSAAYVKASYNNQNDPSTFVIAGIPESYFFSGYVFEKNNPVSRKLYLHCRLTGELAGTTTSSGNGYYYIETAISGSYYIVCLDNDAGTEYNDLIIGRAFPTLVT